MEFTIQHEWNSAPIQHDPVTLCLKPAPDGLQMDVSAPFFNDPPAPLGPAGEPFQALWDYEVVEAFFLNSEKEQYLEVELGPKAPRGARATGSDVLREIARDCYIQMPDFPPWEGSFPLQNTEAKLILEQHGHHLVLLLSHRRKIWKQCLPLSFQASISQETWKGRALIPWQYFPPSVDRFNAYAIHGSGLKRTYEALYPIPEEEVQEGQQPDFHRLEYFRPFNYEKLMGEEWKEPASSLWKM